jgi:RNA polymerase sigma-70 factor, ECF subfamily
VGASSQVRTVAQQNEEDGLLARLRMHDPQAFLLVHQLYQGRLLRISTRIVKNHADAEDAVQDAFLLAFRNIGTFKGESSLATWLTRIVLNSSLMILRQHRRHPLVPLDDPSPHGATFGQSLRDKHCDIENELIDREISKLLDQAIAQLRPQLREVLEYQRGNEASLKQVASHEGLTVAAVKSRLARARRQLKRSVALVRSGGSRPALGKTR